MKLKLKEEPVEWLKFTAVMALMLALVAGLLFRRHVIPRAGIFGVLAMALLALLVCWIRPRWFRGFYRVGMTVSFHFGQVMGKVLLTIFFLLVVTPLGLVLLEAAACGTPAVALRGTVAAACIDRYGSGVVVDAFHEGLFGELRALVQSDRFSKMRVQARAMAADHDILRGTATLLRAWSVSTCT